MDELVLIVEDDADIVEILRLYLEGSGYRVQSAPNGKVGLALLRSCDVSCVLVDLMMPVLNGFDFVKMMRAYSEVPVIVLSARSQPADKTLALDLGADGYIAKPFDPSEVLAYVRSAIRRYTTMGTRGAGTTADATSVIRAGDFELNLSEVTLRKRGTVIPLTAFEFKIMAKFFSSPGRVFTKAQLYEAVMGDSYGGAQDTITVHVSNIRSKIEDDPSNPTAVVTVRGLGYRFDAK